MYKVRIYYSGLLDYKVIDTELPKIPDIGTMIGFWHGGNWLLCKVTSAIFELDGNDIYLRSEINVTDIDEN